MCPIKVADGQLHIKQTEKKCDKNKFKLLDNFYKDIERLKVRNFYSSSENIFETFSIDSRLSYMMNSTEKWSIDSIHSALIKRESNSNYTRAS